MANRVGDLTHNWIFNNDSGDTLDLVASRDITHSGTFSLDGDHVTYTATNGKGLFASATDFYDVAGGGVFSMLIKFRVDANLGGFTTIFSPASGIVSSPTLIYESGSGTLSFRLRFNAVNPIVSFNTSGLGLVGKTAVFAVAWDPSDNTLRASSLKTTGDDTPVGASINSAGSDPTANAQALGDTPGGNFTGGIFKLGVKLGEAFSQADLDDTQTDFLQGLGNGINIRSSLLRRGVRR